MNKLTLSKTRQVSKAKTPPASSRVFPIKNAVQHRLAPDSANAAPSRGFVQFQPVLSAKGVFEFTAERVKPTVRLWIADRHLFGIIIQKRVTDGRSCGLIGTEIGKILGVDYSTVSPGGKRLREKRKRDKNLSALLGKTEVDLS